MPRRDECPTYQDASQQSVWCFSVEKSAPTGYTQQLGQFRFGSTTFTVVASGAVADVRSGGTDVMTLVIYPEPRARIGKVTCAAQDRFTSTSTSDGGTSRI